jgi:ribosomal protein S14
MFWKFKKDNYLRHVYNRIEKKKLILRYFIKCKLLPLKYRYFLYTFVFLHLPKKSSISLICNRCTLTFRAGGVLRKFKLSRHMFRRYASKGRLTGIKKHNL